QHAVGGDVVTLRVSLAGLRLHMDREFDGKARRALHFGIARAHGLCSTAGIDRFVGHQRQITWHYEVAKVTEVIALRGLKSCSTCTCGCWPQRRWAFGVGSLALCP